MIARAPEDFAGLDAALAEIRAAGADRLIIDGGDGTVREVLSRAPEIWGDAPLAYAIVANGNTNLIARSAGALTGDPVAALERSTPLTLNMLTFDRQGERPIRGFIFGAGAYEMATRIAQKEMESRHALQVALVILRLVFGRRLRDGARFGLGRDNGEVVEAQRMLFGATTLPGRLILGCEPFWDQSGAPIRWLEIDANPPAPLIAAPFVAYGRPMGWMRKAYRSGSSQSVELRLDDGFVVDGERFQPGADGIVRVTAEETATFLAPR